MQQSLITGSHHVNTSIKCSVVALVIIPSLLINSFSTQSVKIGFFCLQAITLTNTGTDYRSDIRKQNLRQIGGIWNWLSYLIQAEGSQIWSMRKAWNSPLILICGHLQLSSHRKRVFEGIKAIDRMQGHRNSNSELVLASNDIWKFVKN